MHEIEAPEERSQVSGTLIGAFEGIRNGTKTEIGKIRIKILSIGGPDDSGGP